MYGNGAPGGPPGGGDAPGGEPPPEAKKGKDGVIDAEFEEAN
jgi:hypothetical protein